MAHIAHQQHTQRTTNKRTTHNTEHARWHRQFCLPKFAHVVLSLDPRGSIFSSAICCRPRDFYQQKSALIPTALHPHVCMSLFHILLFSFCFLSHRPLTPWAWRRLHQLHMVRRHHLLGHKRPRGGGVAWHQLSPLGDRRQRFELGACSRSGVPQQPVDLGVGAGSAPY